MSDPAKTALQHFAMRQEAERRETIGAIADMGRAAGLEAGVKILRSLAAKRRRIDASELLGAAAAMESTAEEIRKKADAVIEAAKGKKS